MRLLVRSIGVKIEKALRCSLAAVALSAALAFLPAAPAPDGASTPAVFVLPSVAPATKLEEIILSKEAKMPSYRQGCQEVWLLIVAHGFEPSTHCEVDPRRRSKTTSSRRASTAFSSCTTPTSLSPMVDPRRINSAERLPGGCASVLMPPPCFSWVNVFAVCCK